MSVVAQHIPVWKFAMARRKCQSNQTQSERHQLWWHMSTEHLFVPGQMPTQNRHVFHKQPSTWKTILAIWLEPPPTYLSFWHLPDCFLFLVDRPFLHPTTSFMNSMLILPFGDIDASNAAHNCLCSHQNEYLPPSTRTCANCALLWNNSTHGLPHHKKWEQQLVCLRRRNFLCVSIKKSECKHVPGICGHTVTLIVWTWELLLRACLTFQLLVNHGQSNQCTWWSCNITSNTVRPLVTHMQILCWYRRSPIAEFRYLCGQHQCNEKNILQTHFQCVRFVAALMASQSFDVVAAPKTVIICNEGWPQINFVKRNLLFNILFVSDLGCTVFYCNVDIHLNLWLKFIVFGSEKD